MIFDPCLHCEAVMQKYLDRVLDDAERATAEAHLAACADCAKRYKFEVDLRRIVRTACAEGMPPDLKQRLAALRTPLL
jgi:mycothiol system anti-sigma-R factor